MSISNVLTIAGSDPSGGAGIQADLKTFSALGCYGMSVITALTAQNTHGVNSIYKILPTFVENQLEAIFEDIRVDVVKIGMLADVDIIKSVANILEKYKPSKVVLDPVMISKNGKRLLNEDAVDVMKNSLFPLATIITPNALETKELLPSFNEETIEDSARELAEIGGNAIVIKGGHLEGDFCTDTLFANGEFYYFKNPRIYTKNTHGTGCTFASAIAGFLAKGHPVHEAVEQANAYIHKAIKAADSLSVGQGAGPVQHFV